MPVRKKIGELLVAAGAVTESEVRDALGHQKAWGGGKRLGELLMATHGVTAKAVAHALAAQFELPFVELPSIPARLGELVPADFMARHRLVPFRLEGEGKGERLHVAMADPAALATVDELRFKLQRTLVVHVAATDDVDKALAELAGEKEDTLEPIAIEDAEAELEVERSPSQMVVGGWFGPPPAPAPAASPAPAEEAPSAAPKPEPGAGARSAAEQLDDLLGGMTAPEGAPASPPAAHAPVAVLKFGADRAAAKKADRLDFTEQDLRVLDALERVADGAEAPPSEAEKIRPERMMASLVRLLIRKGVIHELEFLEELARK